MDVHVHAFNARQRRCTSGTALKTEQRGNEVWNVFLSLLRVSMFLLWPPCAGRLAMRAS